MYKVTNTSRYLAFAGLYPGEVKKLSVLNNELLELQSKGLVTIEKIVEKTKVKEKITEENKDNILEEDKKSEVK